MNYQWSDVLALVNAEYLRTLQKLSAASDLVEVYRLQGELKRLQWVSSIPETLKDLAKKE